MNKKYVLLAILVLMLCMCSIWEYSTISNEALTEAKVAYITFDDGPSLITYEILDILRENDVRATFFLVGSKINDETKPLIEQMIADGHQIGVHTFSHDASCIYCSADAYYEDVINTASVINKYVGINPDIYRFPWGSNNAYIMPYREEVISRLRDKGLEYCDWNVSGEDSVGKPTASQIISNINANYVKYNQPVILLHDSASNEQTAKALPEIIRMYKEAGYGFATVEERYRICQWSIK